ncbi:cell wall-binding repeat-containing protein [Catenulispora sp. NL8]|uniref:Cell wall-binding repeat-containing protein n=1 Tax=Catenulispora pinistramenti TaxID=2705254 RepID=A0ABS5KKG8_9ACTN|nr:cell wall-binding repeat-containing protein [Catenulispora pinistramenti]MBS2546334.1 cell wall-binding repeat-containing protein [Catenulispora pinistramenti]
MSDSSARRPLALTATIATSVAAAASMFAPAAHATTASPNGTANLTLSGNWGGTAGGTANVGGTKYAVSSAPKATDLAWSPTGARAAWIDQTDGAVMAGVPGGAAQMIAPAAPNGTTRSHPAWIDGGSQVVWSEKSAGANGGFAVLKAAYGDGLQTDSSGGPAVRQLLAVPNADLVHPDAVGATLVFEQDPAGQASLIRGWDLSAAGTSPYTIATGWGPSLSPNGATVAFVNSTTAPNTQPSTNLFTVPSATAATPAAPHQVTGRTGGGPVLQNAVWTPDGGSLVFQYGSPGSWDTMSVPANAAATTTFTPIVAGAKSAGEPAFQPNVKDHVIRLAGTDRLGTAIKASQSAWAAPGAAGPHANAVVLSRSDQFADALGGSALAAKVGGPLLLTQTAGLNGAVQAEIQRVLGRGDGTKTVYVLGGVKALSPAVANALTALHYKVQRVGGDDRFSTAVDIANTITGGAAPDYVLVATGEGYADPLSAGAAAGAINAHQGKNAVVLLTDDKVMPKATTDYLAPLLARTNLNADHSKPANFIELDSIGGQATTALGSHWIPAGYQAGSFLGLSGLDRYETSYFVARYFFGGADAAGLATGMNWADALSGGAEMGQLDGPLMLVNPKTGVTPEVAQWLNQNNGQFTTVGIFGGTAAVPGSVDKAVGGLIAGAGGVDYPSNPAV